MGDDEGFLERYLVFAVRGPYRLPREVWKMVQRHGIGRLFFVMNTAAQLSKLDDGILNPSDERFTINTLSLKSDQVRIHLVNIGCRTYIRRLSDPTESHTDIPGSSSNGAFWNIANVLKPFFSGLETMYHGISISHEKWDGASRPEPRS